jgi:hypothetical protein
MCHVIDLEMAVLSADYVRDTFMEGEEYVFMLNVTNHFRYTSPIPAFYSVYICALLLVNGMHYSPLSPAQVSFAFDPVPTVAVVPMHRLDVLTTRVGRSVKLHGAATTSGALPYPCIGATMVSHPLALLRSACAITFLEPRDQLQFSWTQVEGPAFQVNNDTSNTPVLFMGPGTLKANQTYTLNLRAQHASYARYRWMRTGGIVNWI